MPINHHKNEQDNNYNACKGIYFGIDWDMRLKIKHETVSAMLLFAQKFIIVIKRFQYE